MSRHQKAVIEKRVYQRMSEDDVQSVVENMFGNLKTVDPDVADKKRYTMSSFLDKIAEDLQRLIMASIEACSTECVPESLQRTAEWAKFISTRKDFLQKHPHQWLEDPLLDNLHQLKESIIAVNAATASSIAKNQPDQFLKWNNDYKALLPSNGKPFNFSEIPMIMPLAFQTLRRLEMATTAVLKEALHPSYDWQYAMDMKLAKMCRSLKKHMIEGLMSMKPTFISQLPSLYMRKIGVSTRGVDWGVVVTRIMDIDPVEQMKIFEEGEKMIMGNDNREFKRTAENMFGKDLLETVFKGAHEG